MVDLGASAGLTLRDRVLVRQMVEEGVRVVLRKGQFPTVLNGMGRFVRWLPWSVVERLEEAGAVERIRN